MSDRRRLFRNRVYYGGLIAFNARHSTLECVVRDFSPFGAKIQCESLEIVPDELDFAVPRRGLSCVARLAWRDHNAAGLVFEDSPETNRVVPLEWARKLRASERTNKQLRARIEQLRSEYWKPQILKSQNTETQTLKLMSAVEQEQVPILATGRPPQRPRYLRMILLAMFAQYAIVSLVVGLSVAATLRYFVTPQIVAKFEALSEALKHQGH